MKTRWALVVMGAWTIMALPWVVARDLKGAPGA